MKKVALILAVVALSSCGTLLGGKRTECQKHKPEGQTRQIRPAALIGDIFTGWVWLGVDFATGAIYKPCKETKVIPGPLHYKR